MNRRLVLIAIALTMSGADAKDPTLKTVLARASDYVVRFERDLSGIVAEEHYTQNIEEEQDARDSHVLPESSEPTHRVLRSDLLLVRVSGSDQYVQFRD